MIDKDAKGISYTGGFFILIAFCIAGLIFADVIAIPVWQNMTGQSFKNFEKGLTDPANSDAVKIIQSISSVLGFFLPALVVAYILNRKPAKLLGFTGPVAFRPLSLVLGIMILALLVSVSLTWFNDRIPIPESWRVQFTKAEEIYNQRLEAIMKLDSTGEFILSLVVMAFLPALCEETLFRGGLQNFLTRATKIPWLSILIVSIIFSLAHWSYFGFMSRLFLGIILGLIYHYTGRLWLCIIAHFLNNALAVTMLYVNKLQGKPMKDAVGENASVAWPIILLPVVIGLLIWLRKISTAKEIEQPVRTDLLNPPSN